MFAKPCVASFVILLFTAFASIVMGQVVGEPYRIDDRQVEKIIHRIEQQSDRFRSSLDAALDKSRFNGSSREDDINAFVPGPRVHIEGRKGGPLSGLTFAAKDLFDVAGFPTGGGNPDWARSNPVPTRHA